MEFATRFAPSPTGLLHKGHAFSALMAWQRARAAGGRFVLRLEDGDFTRCRPEYEAAILDDLRWLGLSWEEPVIRQSERRAIYDGALERLRDMGVLYRCFRTRAEVMALAGGAPHESDPRDTRRPGPHPPDEEAALLAEGRPFAWRLSLERASARLGGFSHLSWTEEGRGPQPCDAARLKALGDMVVGRKDIGVGYVIASVIDDAGQGITHVIRGEDLREITLIQRVLQALLDLPTPVYSHHRLILAPDGRRLAKRDRDDTLAAMRARGVSLAALCKELGVQAPD